MGEALLSYSRGGGTLALQWDGRHSGSVTSSRTFTFEASCQPRGKKGCLIQPLPSCRVGGAALLEPLLQSVVGSWQVGG